MMAAHHGHPEIVRLLLDSGAAVDSCDFVGNTALFFAATSAADANRPACITMLLAAGARPARRNSSQLTALQYANLIGAYAGADDLEAALRARRAGRSAGGKKRSLPANRSTGAGPDAPAADGAPAVDDDT
jgi:ankyrin repeat protein